MIVFGDQVRLATPADCLRSIHYRYAAAASLPPGIARHAALCAAFILAGELAQGIADAEMAACGADDLTTAQAAVMALVTELAAAVAGSWRSGFSADLPRIRPRLAGLPLPGTLTLRQPEGYAHYALYPEAFALAAASLGAVQPLIIGLRSIGTGLAAMAAAALGAAPPITLRPTGHPFDRQLEISPALAATLARQPARPRLVVDEGPGLSGSSFGAVVSWLARAGVPEGNILCLPGHDGAPGEMATAQTRSRYTRLRKAVVSFDTLCVHTHNPAHRLETWFADLVGPAIAPLQDLSGGAWRIVRGLHAPARPAQERRKFLLRTQAGTFLLKFAGLGEIGEAKWQRARRLAAQRLVPEPLGLRHGFLIERWHAEARPPESPAAMLLEPVGRYLAARKNLFPAMQGADLPSLAAMARHNTQEAFGAAAAQSLRFDTGLPVRPIHVDARLHRWEWLCLPGGRMLKADALDHSTGHDLIGGQDVAWDIAGAAVEFDLSDHETETLRRIAASETDPRLVRDCILYYCAFQLGLWSPDPPARYGRRLLNKNGKCSPPSQII